MLTRNKLHSRLKNDYNLAAGEATLKNLIRRINKITKTRIKISGRSYKTGKKKTIDILLKNLL